METIALVWGFVVSKEFLRNDRDDMCEKSCCVLAQGRNVPTLGTLKRVWEVIKPGSFDNRHTKLHLAVTTG